MNHFRFPILAVGVLLTIAACSKSDPVLPEANATAGLPKVDRPAPSAAGERHGGETGPSSPSSNMKIPARFQGRWGLAPGDCTSTKGDAKGLLVVSANELRFYESRAVPSTDVEADQLSGALNGRFNYSGEGQNWSRYESLKVDGQRLVRTESNPTASFSYAKCD
jgi:hypothetical protein